MIDHHQGAVTMAEAEPRDGNDSLAKTLAQNSSGKSEQLADRLPPDLVFVSQVSGLPIRKARPDETLSFAAIDSVIVAIPQKAPTSGRMAAERKVGTPAISATPRRCSGACGLLVCPRHGVRVASPPAGSEDRLVGAAVAEPVQYEEIEVMAAE